VGAEGEGRQAVFRSAAANFRELVRRRELVRFLVVSNLKRSQKNTFLGYLWWLMDPLMLMLVYWLMMVILGRGRAMPGYPLFLFCSLLPWKSFSGALQDSVAAICKNESLIKQVPFPKAVIPISLVLSNFFECVVGVVPLVLVGLAFHIVPTWRYLYLPVPLLVMLTLMLGLTLCVSFFGVWFRDLENILRFVTRLWWYLSPGLYTILLVEKLTKPWQVWVFKLNPFATIFPAIQSAVYFPGLNLKNPSKALAQEWARGMVFDWAGLAVWFGISVAILLVGYLLFVANEHKFGKVL
jgi:ABC-type polysaccharide/polyol phosphate export permease